MFHIICINLIFPFLPFSPPPGANQYGPYGNRSYGQPPPGSSQTPTPPGSAVVGTAGSPTGGPQAPGGGYPPVAPTQQDYYRPPDQVSYKVFFLIIKTFLTAFTFTLFSH